MKGTKTAKQRNLQMNAMRVTNEGLLTMVYKLKL